VTCALGVVCAFNSRLVAYTEKCPSPARNALEEVCRISTGKSASRQEIKH
jgi:hypothetical protein